MLSATVPNYMDFAQWVGRIKNCTIYIQNTSKRVVPLEHRAYINKKNIFLVKDSKDQVHDGEVYKAINAIEHENEKQKGQKYKPETQNERKKYEEGVLRQIKEKFKGLERSEKNKFNNQNNNYGGRGGNNNRGNKITKTHLKLQEIIKYMVEKELTPAVIFVFSIKKIDEYAQVMAVSEPLVSKNESAKIVQFFDKCMSVLSVSICVKFSRKIEIYHRYK
jgi:antiviral helicase SKI2